MLGVSAGWHAHLDLLVDPRGWPAGADPFWDELDPPAGRNTTGACPADPI